VTGATGATGPSGAAGQQGGIGATGPSNGLPSPPAHTALTVTYKLQVAANGVVSWVAG
jgi:hypothetical protein